MPVTLNAAPVHQAESFGFPFSAQQLQQIAHKPEYNEMASEQSGVWTIETVILNQPLIIKSGRHQISPRSVFSPDKIQLSGDSTLLGVRLGKVDEPSTLVEITDSAFAEIAIDGITLCSDPKRQAVPELAHIALYSGTLIWNGCGEVYWPEQLTPQRRGQSWILVTETVQPTSARALRSPVPINSTANSTIPLEDMNQNPSSGLSPPQITGIAIGGVIVVILIAAAVISIATYSPPEPLPSIDWIDSIIELNSAGTGFVWTAD